MADAQRIVFEYEGGPSDGKSHANDSPNETERLWVNRWYEAHHQGKIGSAFMGVPPHAALDLTESDFFKYAQEGAHKYEVVDRREDGNTVFVRYRHRGIMTD
jgi:hypothetical protein